MTDLSSGSHGNGAGDGGPAGGLTERLQRQVARTRSKEVLENVEGLGGLYAFQTKGYKRPVLVSAVGGAGPKLELARDLDRYDVAGTDAVARAVDDLAVTGALPLFVQHHVGAGELEPAQVEQIVSGMADGCEVAGCALLGGQAIALPGLTPPGHYDVACFAVGVVEAQRMLGPGRVEEGDALVAMASTGLHGEGYDLVRGIVTGRDLDDDHGLMVQSLAEALLRPARIYSPDCTALRGVVEVHALCHVTAGGIPGNLPRELPDHLGAVIDTRTFEVPQLFRLVQQWGGIADSEMWRTFNMGAGMLAVVDDGERAVGLLRARGVDAWVCGAVDARQGVRLVGTSGPAA